MGSWKVWLLLTVFLLVSSFLFMPSFILFDEANDIGCFVRGSCDKSPYLGFSKAVDANQCLAFCRNTSGCNYFTYQTPTHICLAYSNCTRVSVDACPDCVSGGTGCEEKKPSCFVAGRCGGFVASFAVRENQEVCREWCLDDGDCERFTFDPDTDICVLLMAAGVGECAVDDAGCPRCVHGSRRDCQQEPAAATVASEARAAGPAASATTTAATEEGTPVAGGDTTHQPLLSLVILVDIFFQDFC
jgi:hypothetical protein